MIIFGNKGYQTRSDKPNEDWTDEALYVVEDGTELANKIMRLYPYYDFVLENEELVDIIEIESPHPIITSQEQREQAYETMISKEDNTPLILWENENLTVDQANKKWLDYSAEGNTEIANKLQGLIQIAKEYIRELYPDN
ncbi:hypothetical protein [Anaerovorax sp. IOR16]|uniref:hypothetical protein n=1 Tax=Anaerovorax sp. IOR16 TaxID=2773458 RepID=UPI0019D24DCE|nr:hypothetical protein [Anaerovorax sp. IOR16]